MLNLSLVYSSVFNKMKLGFGVFSFIIGIKKFGKKITKINEKNFNFLKFFVFFLVICLYPCNSKGFAIGYSFPVNSFVLMNLL